MSTAAAERPTAPPVPRVPGTRTLVRSLTIAGTIMLPAVVLRLSEASPSPVVELLAFGAAVVAASFVLAWAAEAAQVDVSGGFAIAVLAFIAVLPEYAVDLYYAFTAGHDPTFTQYAAANMTGSNRLLLGLGWPLVALVAMYATGKLTKRPVTSLALERGNRLELGFLLVAGVVAFVIPATGQINLFLGFAMIGWFCFYMVKLTRGEAEEPDLIGSAAVIGGLPTRRRRTVVVTLFVVAALVILLSAEPFANALVDTGKDLGIDEFLLVQWLAPLASEAPEFIVAVLFAARGKGTAAMATLISSKINQWTLLIGSLPIAYLFGGGGTSIVLDARQTEEVLLTAAQTMMGIAILLGLRMKRWSAWALLGLFLVQFPVTSTHGRLILTGVYGAIAVVLFAVHYRDLWPTLTAPFRRELPQEAGPDAEGPAGTPSAESASAEEPAGRTEVVVGAK